MNIKKIDIPHYKSEIATGSNCFLIKVNDPHFSEEETPAPSLVG